MEICEIIMETFTLGTAMNASFYAGMEQGQAVFGVVLFLLESTRLESFQRDHGIYEKRVR